MNKTLNWNQLVKGEWYDRNEALYGNSSNLKSFFVYFENKEDAEIVAEWLKNQGGEYAEDVQLNQVYDNEQISDSTQMEVNYEVHNYTE